MISSCYLPTCMFHKLSPMDYQNKLCSGDTKHPSRGGLRDSSSEPVNLGSRWIHPPRSRFRNHSIKCKIQMLLCVWNYSSGNLCNSKLTQTRSIKLMNRARYFCTGMLDIAKYSHWALNVPLYTHFTVCQLLQAVDRKLMV
jgi:hypothetical protein